MDNLLNELETNFDEAEGWIRIVDADWYADDLRISLSVKMYDEDHPKLWEISCEGVVEELLTSFSTVTLKVSDCSSRLLPYDAEKFDIFFAKNECNPAELLGILTSVSVDVFGCTSYLKRFLNQAPTLDGIVSASAGKLGGFPKPYVEALTVHLEKLPIKLSILSTGMPKKWTGAEFIEYPKLQSLEIGESFIIGKDFSANRA